jgi:thymidine kinase
MAAGKSTYALQLNYTLEQAGFRPLLMKPAMDTRDEGVVRSRLGIERECFLLEEGKDIPFTKLHTHLIVDEAQFLSDKMVEQLRLVADMADRPVNLFGLRTSYTGELFPGTAKIMAIADEILELPLIYKDGDKATMHVRYLGKNAVFDGNPTIVGDTVGEERYESVSRRTYYRLKAEAAMNELVAISEEMQLYK